MPDPVFLSVVIPCFNEERRLGRTLSETISFLKHQRYSWEIVVVNDGSSDGTRDVALGFAGNGLLPIRVIEHFPNRGKGFAVKCGMLEAKGDYRLFMDADYAVPIEFAGPLLSLIQNGYDIVVGSRGLRQSQVIEHQPFFRELVAKAFGTVQRAVLRLPLIDTQCGFKLFTRQACENLFPRQTFSCAYFDAEILYIAYRKGLEIGEMGVRWRHDGETRLPIGPRRTLDIITKLFAIRSIHSGRVERPKG